MSKPERQKPYASMVADGGGDAGDSSPSQLDNKHVENSRPMTFQELRNLSLAINMLTCEGLGKVVDIIRTHQPMMLGNDNEFEVDFEKLNTVTLWALEQYARSTIPHAFKEDTYNLEP